MSRNPAVVGKGECPSRDQAMEVEVIHKFLRPGVEHGNEPQSALKVPLGILGKGGKCFIDCGKETVQGDSFVAEDNRIQLMREGEDQVKVAAGKEFGLAVVEPLFFDQGLALGTVSVPA